MAISLVKNFVIKTLINNEKQSLNTHIFNESEISQFPCNSPARKKKNFINTQEKRGNLITVS